jgi:UDP-GlcNAc:undecaprenyl-phosphate/decaprenyl-phosphate GlcNAc-1-phosphate transferase
VTPWSGLAVAIVTLVCATACLALVRPHLAKWGAIDVPNQRSSHTKPTVRGGGVGIVFGLITGLGLGAALLGGPGQPLVNTAVLSLTVATLAILGLAEDLRGLNIPTRLIGQAVVIAIATACLAFPAGQPITITILALASGIFYVNAANFMDGVNGISGLHGTLVGAYFAIIGYTSKDLALTLAGISVAVAFASFLPWNAPRPQMFLGDAGSYALGGSAWTLSHWALNLHIPPLVVVAPLLLYGADVAFTILRRAVKRAPLFQSHHDHAYQQLQEITGSHGWPTGIVTLGTLICAAFGLWTLFVPRMLPTALGAILLVVALFLAAPRLLSPRSNHPSQDGSTSAEDELPLMTQSVGPAKSSGATP